MSTMSPELIGILTVGAILLSVGIALAGLMVANNRALRLDMASLETHLREEIKQSETRLRRELSGLRDDLKQLEQRVARLEHGQARLEGLLEGLREAITHARAAS
jgi:predicted nuclease with TOPRIM domain